jgi:hypothetical protein
MEAMVVTVALFLAERVVKERMEVTVVMAGMVEAGIMEVMAAAEEMVEMVETVEMAVMAETLGQVRVEMAEKEETPMVDLRALL